jgi:hypothetical protein
MYVAFLLKHSFHANCFETLAFPYLLEYGWLFPWALGRLIGNPLARRHLHNAPSREILIHPPAILTFSSIVMVP